MHLKASLPSPAAGDRLEGLTAAWHLEGGQGQLGLKHRALHLLQAQDVGCIESDLIKDPGQAVFPSQMLLGTVIMVSAEALARLSEASQ